MTWVHRATTAIAGTLLQLSLLGAAAPCAMHGGHAARAHAGMQMPDASGAPTSGGHQTDGPCRGPSMPDGCASMPACAMIVAETPQTTSTLSIGTSTPAISAPPALKLGVAIAPELPPPRI